MAFEEFFMPLQFIFMQKAFLILDLKYLEQAELQIP